MALAIANNVNNRVNQMGNFKELYVGAGSTIIFKANREGCFSGAANYSGAPLKWNNAGSFYASSADITGAITATSGTIGSFTIGTYLYTGTKTAYNDANTGVHLGSDGIGIGNNVFTVSSAGALVATSATVTGDITATTGSLGTLTILSGGYIKLGQTAYNTGNGFWMGDVSGTTKLSIGNSAGDYLAWDGSALNFYSKSSGANQVKITDAKVSFLTSDAEKAYIRTATGSDSNSILVATGNKCYIGKTDGTPIMTVDQAGVVETIGKFNVGGSDGVSGTYDPTSGNKIRFEGGIATDLNA